MGADRLGRIGSGAAGAVLSGVPGDAGRIHGLIGWDMAEMGGVNLLDVFPAGVLLFPALYAAVKIAGGVLVLYFGKRHVQKKREEEMQ